MNMSNSKYTIETEKETVLTNMLELQGNYCWIEDFKTLYRILENDSDLQPDAIVIENGSLIYNMCEVGKFDNSQKAFHVMAYNTSRMMEALNQLRVFDEEYAESPDNNRLPEKLESPKTFLACYMFNYFGRDTVGDKVIDGAFIDVAFRPYKNGKLVQFYSEEETCAYFTTPSRIIDGGRKEKVYLADLVNVSYDHDNYYKVTRNDELIKMVCDYFGWDRIDIEVEDVSLSYMECEYMSSIYECGKEIFEKFLQSHSDDFDITDNQNAQCPAYGWAEH